MSKARNIADLLAPTKATVDALGIAATSVTGAQASAITANTAKVTYPSADSSKLSAVEVGATADQTKADLNAIGVSGGRKNLIINGGFDVWQRGTSFTADNSFTADRWKTGDGTGGSPARTASQQTFTLGQTDVPNAHYYLRHDQTGASTSGNSSLVQKVEDVTTTAGQTVTFSFYAKANSSMTLDARFIQSFGTGGSPSSSTTTTESGVTIGTSWTKYTITKAIPSITGKTLGTDGIHTSSFIIDIELKPTTTYMFEITQVQLELGSVATAFEHRSYGEELALCQRYYQQYTQAPFLGVCGSSTLANRMTMQFPVEMRVAPTAVIGAHMVYDGSSSSGSISSVGSRWSDKWGYQFDGTSSGAAFITGRACLVYQSGNTTTTFSAEL